jgi:hypothetical protein
MLQRVSGYEAVMRVYQEEPELIPLVRACFDYGTESFKKKWVVPGEPGTLGRLVGLGVLERDQPAGADANAVYRFVDRDGAGRALSELVAAPGVSD